MSVVCVDDSYSKLPTTYSLPDGPLEYGKRYEIIGMLTHHLFNNATSYRLAGIRVFDMATGGETGFLHSRFVTVEYFESEFPLENREEITHERQMVAK